jgi:predicted nucleotidyltransferase component of viral defense system
MVKPPKNLGASVRARLFNLARETGQPFDVLLTRFVHERLLYRLSLSAHADRFVLKGAMLLATWFPGTARGTRDLDLLGFGDPGEQAILGVFREVLAIIAEDGIDFDLAALSVSRIHDDLEYGGVRLRTTATLYGARVTVLVDIGFGDAIEPGLEAIDYPVLLDLPVPRLRAYARETVIAEKFKATPDALTPEFADDSLKQRQWVAFAADIEAPAQLRTIIDELADFLMAAAKAARAAGDSDKRD